MSDQEDDGRRRCPDATEVEDLVASETDTSQRSDANDSDRSRPYRVLASRQPATRTDDIDALEAAQSEARKSLDRTIDAIEQKDDKAMRTVRISLVLFGFAVTAVSSVPTVAQLANWVTVSGFGCLVLSTGVGIATYTGTDYPSGVGSSHMEDVQDAAWTEGEWRSFMALEYEEWLRDTSQLDSGEGQWLFVTHALQALGLLLTLCGIFVAAHVLDPVSILPIEVDGETANDTAALFYSIGGYLLS